MAEQKSVLIVEDEAGLRDLYQEKLTAAGFLVFAVGNGEEAISQAGQHDLDMIVLDVMLPGTSGLDVLAKLRADKKHEQTPVLILSALEAVEDRARGLALGANVYASKNELSPDMLAAKVAELVAGKA